MTFKTRFLWLIAAGMTVHLRGALGAPAPAMFKGDPSLTGVYPGPSPRHLDGVRFTFQANGPIRSTPTVYDGSLYVGSADGAFYALDASTGKARWRADVGIVDSTAAAEDGLVYVAGRDHVLRALSTADGTTRWTHDLGSDLGDFNYWDFYSSSPTLFGDALYIGSGDGHLYAFDRKTGALLWRFDAGSRIRATPGVTDEAVVFGTQSGYVFGVDRKTGTQLWRHATRGVEHDFAYKHNDTTSLFASPTIADGIVLIGSRDGYLYALDLTNGAERWSITHDGSSWILSNAVDDGVAYVGSGSAFFIQATDLKTGAERWRLGTPGAIFASPALVGDVVIAGVMDGTLLAIDKHTGKELWRFAAEGRCFSSPVFANGVVYTANDAGVLYALDTSDRPPASHADVKKYVYSQPKGQDFSWLSDDVSAASFAYFKAQGYEPLDEPGLIKAMNEQLDDGGGRLIVFATDQTPPGIAEEKDGPALIRRYLDAGGRAAFVTSSPIAFVRGEDGLVSGFDYEIAGKILGVSYLPETKDWGYHVSAPTPEGVRWGLRGGDVSSEGVDPASVSDVLERDQFGAATAWAKSYADKGGMLVQLHIPTKVLTNLTPYRLAIEHGLD